MRTNVMLDDDLAAEREFMQMHEEQVMILGPT